METRPQSEDELLKAVLARGGVKCPACGYEITLLDAGRCTECGVELDLETIIAGGARPLHSRFVRFVTSILIGCIALALIGTLLLHVMPRRVVPQPAICSAVMLLGTATVLGAWIPARPMIVKSRPALQIALGIITLAVSIGCLAIATLLAR